MSSNIKDDDPIKCFECGAPIRRLIDRGLAVTEGIVLCEHCCEQHEPKKSHLEIAAWSDDRGAA